MHHSRLGGLIIDCSAGFQPASRHGSGGAPRPVQPSFDTRAIQRARCRQGCTYLLSGAQLEQKAM